MVSSGGQALWSSKLVRGVETFVRPSRVLKDEDQTFPTMVSSRDLAAPPGIRGTIRRPLCSPWAPASSLLFPTLPPARGNPSLVLRKSFSSQGFGNFVSGILSWLWSSNKGLEIFLSFTLSHPTPEATMRRVTHRYLAWEDVRKDGE